MFETLLAEVEATFRPLPGAAPFLAGWPKGGERRTVAPNALPVLAELDRLAAPSATAGVWQALRAAAPGLAWGQTYGAGDFGAEFLERYGWSEFVGLRGPVPSDSLACGVLLLGPGITYPLHRHEAEELYLPIAGQAEWAMGAGPFRPVPPGEPIHHAPWVPHAMRCGAMGMAALYLWRGGPLAAKSEIVGG